MAQAVPYFWQRFEHDPRRPEVSSLRASDIDRGHVNDLLGQAYAEGRLTHEELQERCDLAARARTLGDLPPIVVDLVAPPAPPGRLPARGATGTAYRAEAERYYREQRRRALTGFLIPSMITWIVWIAILVGSGHAVFPFPAIVTVATGMPLVTVLMGREDTIARRERKLERRAQRSALRHERRQALPPPRYRSGPDRRG